MPRASSETQGWVYEPDRQIQLLDYFWGRIKEGEGRALVFYYVNRGNPIDESISRLVVGVGRVAKVAARVHPCGSSIDPRRPR